MAEIGHRAWRDYEAARILVDDAMMTLLVATRLGALHVEEASLESGVLLPEAFPQIAGIERVRVGADRARWLLEAAEQHLAMMAIPYLLGVQEAFLLDCLALLRRFGKDDPADEDAEPPFVADPNKIGVGALHRYVASRCGVELDRDELFLFEFLVALRNRIVHHGGKAKTLAAEYRKGLKDTNQRKLRPAWEELSGRPLVIDEGGVLVLGEAEMIAALALCRRLAVAVNGALGGSLEEADWVVIVIEETAVDPARMRPAELRDRRLRTQARMFFSALEIDPDALVEEGARRYP